jgi:methionine aminotransferase
MFAPAGLSIFAEMTALAQRYGALNLAQGFPEFGPDPELIAAFHRALDAESAQYAPMPGLLRLREAIAADQLRRNSIAYDPQHEVTVVPGATVGIFSAIQALCGPGDEVILLEPAYDSYHPAVVMAGAVPVAVPLEIARENVGINWDALTAAVTARTRMIVVNTPHNPTGMVWTHQDWAELAARIPEHVVVLSDEVYETMVFDGVSLASPHHHPSLRHRSLRTLSFGKTYHVTGWKLGVVLAPEHLSLRLRTAYQFIAFSASTPAQHAVVDFLESRPVYPNHLADFFQAKRDLLAASLADSGFQPLHSAGSYFLLVDYSAVSDRADREFAEQLTREAGVATVPLSPFYRVPPKENRMLRMCFAKDDATLREAGHRIRTWK